MEKFSKEPPSDSAVVSLEKLPFELPYFTDAVKWQAAYQGRKP